MIDVTAPLVGPRDLTKNQLINLINTKIGGWPIKATTVYMFESNSPKETVYNFADERAMSLDKRQTRRFCSPLWTKRLTVDEYLVHHLSREAKQSFLKAAHKAILGKLGALV